VSDFGFDPMLFARELKNSEITEENIFVKYICISFNKFRLLINSENNCLSAFNEN